MKLKRFESKDLVYNTIVAKPENSFIIHKGQVFYQQEKPATGSYGNKIKHIKSGEISLHELNIDRPADSMIYSFIEKNSTRYAWKSVSTSDFDDSSQFSFGDVLTQSYPLTSSINRIFIPSGAEYSSSAGLPHANKKYITALENVIRTQGPFSHGLEYGTLGTDNVNMICIPGIFYGSSIDKGTIRLRYSITGTLAAEAADIHADGRLIQVSGATTGSIVGSVIYNQGLLILNSSASLDPVYVDNFSSTTSSVSPSWINFGTGITQTGQALSHGTVVSSSYSVYFKGINKIPTLTMYTYAKKGEHNYSHNPSFLSQAGTVSYDTTDTTFVQRDNQIKKINKSIYSDYEEEFENTTYISKVGIYDKNKNLIAVATLANPLKKTEKRDFMIKLKMDF